MPTRRYPKPFIWKPKNPSKYIGKSNSIVSRSSWETRLFSFLDRNQNVVAWNSEDVVVKYISPVDNRIHNYHVDVIAQMKVKSGDIKIFAIEIKPRSQMLPPVVTENKKPRRLLEEIETYQVNQAKWEAARCFFAEKNITFLVLNEYDIGIAKEK